MATETQDEMIERLCEEAEEAKGTIDVLETRLRRTLELLYPAASPYELGLYVDGVREINS
jgi:hypothetical protein